MSSERYTIHQDIKPYYSVKIQLSEALYKRRTQIPLECNNISNFINLKAIAMECHFQRLRLLTHPKGNSEAYTISY